MTLAALLRQIGRQSLGTQDWIKYLIVTLNAVLPEAHRIDTTTSGHAALGAISLLPEKERNHLLDSDVNPLDGSLVYVEIKQPSEVIAEPTAVDPPTDKPAESFHHQVLMDLMSDGRRTFLFVLSIIFVITAVIIVVITASVYDKHAKDTNLFMRLLHALLDLMDALTGNFQPNNDYTPQ